jgi:hypothetical protein
MCVLSCIRKKLWAGTGSEIDCVLYQLAAKNLFESSICYASAVAPVIEINGRPWRVKFQLGDQILLCGRPVGEPNAAKNTSVKSVSY